MGGCGCRRVGLALTLRRSFAETEIKDTGSREARVVTLTATATRTPLVWT